MRPEEASEELIQRVREEATLASIEALLEWEEETQMPAGAVEEPDIDLRDFPALDRDLAAALARLR